MIPGCRFLDAFAGNGGVGLEALSRGAAKVVLVDRAAAAVEAAKENARALASAGGEVQVFRQDARTAIGALGDQGMQFDVVYLDPPYASDLYEPLLALLGEGPLLAEGGVVVAEHFHKRALPETIGALTRTREKRVGDHVLSFYRRASGADSRVGGGGESEEEASEGSLAVFPGSFDPITNGHLDIVDRGLAVFDRVRMAILMNPEKQPLFTVEERVAIIREAYRGNPRVEVDTFSGLLVDYASRVGASVIIRGLRAISDFEYEFQMALMNRRLDPRIETVFMMPAESYSYVSSRLVKEVFQLGGRVSDLVPPVVERRLSEKYGTPIQAGSAAPPGRRGSEGGSGVKTASDGAPARRARAAPRGVAHGGDGGEGARAQGDRRAGLRLHGGRARPAHAAPRAGGRQGGDRRGAHEVRPGLGPPRAARGGRAPLPRGLRGRLRARGGDGRGRRQAGARPPLPGRPRPGQRGRRPDPGLADVRRGGAGGRRHARSSSPSPRGTASASPPARWRRRSRRRRARSS